MTPLLQVRAAVALEGLGAVALAAVVLPAMIGTGITRPGVAILAGIVIAVYGLGVREPLGWATPAALLLAAGLWLLAHASDSRQVRGAVVAGLLLLVAEEARELARLLRRPAMRPGPTIAAWLPRMVGVAAAALVVDALVAAYLSSPISSGWIWRVVGATALVVLLGVAGTRVTDS